MNATSRFLPSASSPWSVAGPSARQSPALTFWPFFTIGRWLKQVPELQRRNFWRSYRHTPFSGAWTNIALPEGSLPSFVTIRKSAET